MYGGRNAYFDILNLLRVTDRQTDRHSRSKCRTRLCYAAKKVNNDQAN